MLTIAKTLMGLMLMLTLGYGPVLAQGQGQGIIPPQGMTRAGKPVMETVFYNVLWGSASGLLLGTAASIIASSDKTQPKDFSNYAIQGTSFGGVMGLIAGVYLVFAEINFVQEGALPFDTSATAPLNPWLVLPLADAHSMGLQVVYHHRF